MKNSLPEGYQVHPASMDDLEATVEMFNIDARHLVGVDKFIPQEIGNEWQTPGFDLDTDTRVVSTQDGQIVGYCEVWDLKPHVSIRCWGGFTRITPIEALDPICLNGQRNARV